MTDLYNILYVALDHDIRSDDAEALISAISQFRGVAAVTPKVVDSSDWVAHQRVRQELAEKLWQVLHGDKKEHG